MKPINPYNHKHAQSFTLIELLVVIVIIGILSGLVVIATSSFIEKANFSKAQAFSSTIHKELLSSLVAEWTFDELTPDGKIKDTWGNNHGTIYGATQVDDCVFGKCLYFDGNDYVEINDDLVNPSSFSVSLWAKAVKVADWGYIIHRSSVDSIGGSIYWMGVNTNSNYASAVNGRYSQGNTGVSASNKAWAFLVLSFDGNTQKTYVDGALKVTDTITTITNNLVDNKVTLGGTVLRLGYRPIVGFLDDLRIYSSALSSAQIKQNYIAGLNSMLNKGTLSKEEYNQRISNLAYEN